MFFYERDRRNIILFRILNMVDNSSVEMQPYEAQAQLLFDVLKAVEQMLAPQQVIRGYRPVVSCSCPIGIMAVMAAAALPAVPTV